MSTGPKPGWRHPSSISKLVALIALPSQLRTTEGFLPRSSIVRHSFPSTHSTFRKDANPITSKQFHRSNDNNEPSSSKTALGLNTKPLSYEELSQKLPSQKVIEAIESSPSRNVIASDVASTAGVSLSQARRELTALATLTQGDIAVSNEGELIYTFPSNIAGVLSSNSRKYRITSALENKVYPALFYGLRVSFGVLLLVSIAAIFSTIAVISSSSSSNDDRRDDRRGGGTMGFGGGFWGPSPFDFFYYRPYGYYYNNPKGGRRRRPIQVRRTFGGGYEYYREEEKEDEMGFLESVFSYIFGDGNPNTNIEEERLKMAANLIRENEGAVTAEQLAPFCDDAPVPNYDESRSGDDGGSAYVDERFVLPIVTELGGEPQVTDEGDIVYVFSELQKSAASSSSSSTGSVYVTDPKSARVLERAGLEEDVSTREIKQFLEGTFRVSTRGALERSDLINKLDQVLVQVFGPDTKQEQQKGASTGSMLQEQEYKFSVASDFQRLLSGGLGVINLGGALYLGNLLSSPALVGVQLPAYFGLVQAFYPLLLGYAVLFNAIPLVRSFWIKSENEKIQKRNQIRRSWNTVLQAASGGAGKLSKKLKAARQYGSKLRRLGASKDDIVFDTKQDVIEMKENKEADAMKEFDKMLDMDSFQ
mmetsp:Transcript_54416/g.80773  ORF Transcript_54416/g.80773 Transcript_54416/m.80773 type:complete len:648 (-) Transcript_54416:400-2343(-)